MDEPLQLSDLRCETIFLDAGGVLVWPNWGRIADVLGSRGITVTAAELAEVDPAVRRELDFSDELLAATDQRRGWRYFELILERNGIPLTNATESALSALRSYHDSANLWEYVPNFVQPTLRQLRQQGLRLVVVSNANGTLCKAFHRLGLDSLVDLIVDSAEVGIEKPDRRLFDIALARSGARRARTVHVGDFYNIDVVGARAAGLIPILVDEGGLYGSIDCIRVRSLAELPELIALLATPGRFTKRRGD
jgi:putative hydrolase of the HAD superfamily